MAALGPALESSRKPQQRDLRTCPSKTSAVGLEIDLDAVRGSEQWKIGRSRAKESAQTVGTQPGPCRAWSVCLTYAVRVSYLLSHRGVQGLV